MKKTHMLLRLLAFLPDISMACIEDMENTYVVPLYMRMTYSIPLKKKKKTCHIISI